MHQAMGGVTGQASDIEIAAREIVRNNELIKQILVERTGQTLERITQDTDRDFFLSVEETEEYGVVDDVLTSPSEPAGS